MEMLGQLCDAEKTARLLRSVKRMQKKLGDANDLRVSHDLVDELANSGADKKAIVAAGKAVLDLVAKPDEETQVRPDGLLGIWPTLLHALREFPSPGFAIDLLQASRVVALPVSVVQPIAHRAGSDGSPAASVKSPSADARRRRCAWVSRLSTR